MGITLRLRIDEGGQSWLPIAKAHLAAMNARPNASTMRSTMNYAEAKIVVTRSSVVDTIDISTGQPYIFGYFLFTDSGPRVGNAQVDPDVSIVRLLTTYKSIPRIGDELPTVELARAPFLGDGFVLVALSNRIEAATPADIVVWTALNKLSAQATQYLASDPARIGHSTTFVEDVQMSGTTSIFKSTNVWGSGWQDSDHRYRYGCCGLVDDGTPAHNPTPVIFVGNTKTQQIAEVGVPRAAGRPYYPYTMFVIGPGRLQAIQTVEDSQDPQIPPYFLQSTNHGDTWAAVPADFLIPFTYTTTAVGDRARYSTAQLTAFSRGSTIQYLGVGRQLLVLPGLKDMLGPPLVLGGDPQPRFCYMAFLGTDGAGYSRITWPADDWLVTQAGIQTMNSYIAIFEPSVAETGMDYAGMQMVFGKGCIYFTVVVAGVPQFMVSRNFGASWDFYPRPVGVALIGVTLEPYVSNDTPGKLIFAKPDYPAGRIRFMRTTGKFDEFKTVGTSIRPKQGLLPNTSLIPLNTVFVNFGGVKYSPRVVPALPDEFEPT